MARVGLTKLTFSICLWQLCFEINVNMAPADGGPSENLNLEIIDFIQNLGSCWRCAIRFTRERKPEAYQRKLVVINLLLNSFRDCCVIYYDRVTWRNSN